LFLYLPRFSPEGLTFPLHLCKEGLIILALVAPIQLEAPIFLSLMVSRFLLEVNLKLGGNLNLGDNLRLGYNLKLGGNLRLESITHFMDKMYLCYKLNLGIFLSKEIHSRLGGNILKSILLYPLTSVNCIQFFESHLGSKISIKCSFPREHP
jgi:hypothetical protein